MNNSEIKQGRENYSNLFEERDYYKKLEMELEVLKENPLVKRYFEISDKLFAYNRENNDNESLASKAFDNIAKNTEDSKKVYIFMGYFDNEGEYTVTKDDIEYALFMDIETMKGFKIPYNECNEFKEKNSIIYAADEYELKDILFYVDALSSIRSEYLNSLIKLNQEEAIEEITKKSR